MCIVDIIELGMLFAALLTIVFTQLNAKRQNKRLLEQNELMLKQSRMSLFAEYTRRYQDIIIRMPESVYLGHFDTKNTEVVGFMRLYFDLCSEEYWLNEEKMLPERTWDIWVEGMHTTLKQKSFREAWKYLSGHYDEDFARFFRIEVVEPQIYQRRVER